MLFRVEPTLCGLRVFRDIRNSREIRNYNVQIRNAVSVVESLIRLEIGYVVSLCVEYSIGNIFIIMSLTWWYFVSQVCEFL